MLLVTCALPSAALADPDGFGGGSRETDTQKKPVKRSKETSSPKDTGDGTGQRERNQASERPAAEEVKDWAIVIAVFRGDDAEAQALATLGRVKTEGGLPEAYAERRGPAVVIAYGRYTGADDPQAAADLTRLQALEVERARPYALAYLAPPHKGTMQGGMPQFNLTKAKAVHGDSAIYTLQVGAYGREDLERPTEADLKEARKKAEEAAYLLRQEGELAFYYHGPRMSMVTVGVFTLADFDPQVPSYKSAALLAAQRRHPHNLYNGAGIREKKPGMREGKLQASNLVAIPEK